MTVACPNCHGENPETSRFCANCAAPLTRGTKTELGSTRTIAVPTAVITAGSLIAGKYRILAEAGSGGMGIVYRAEDLKLKRPVALKFLPVHLLDSPELRDRFIVEAQAAAALSHPNICIIHEVGESEERPYIAMEFVEGETVRDKLKRGALKAEEAAEIAAQVASGLAAAHAKGIVHRDIKSANIMVTDAGQAKIMDFGLAKLQGGSSLTRSQTTLGTIAYMSPEQARGEEVDRRTDLWSLGVFLYEMVAGELPFKGDRDLSMIHSIVHEEPKPLTARKPPVPEEIQRTVGRALKKDRGARTASADEMRKDLRGFLDRLAAESAGAFSLRSLIRALRKPAVAVPLAAAFIALGLAGVGFANRRAKIRWAGNVALPEAERLAAESKFSEAFDLAKTAGNIIPDDPRLAALWGEISREVSVETEPAGAQVSIKAFGNPQGEWMALGTTPLSAARVPREYLRWKVEKSGFRTVFRAILGSGGPLRIALDRPESLPPRMVRVPGGRYSPRGPLLLDMPPLDLGDFLIDEFEVTNREFKEFVVQGGYTNKRYWEHPLKKEGKVLSWEAAAALFTDRTGRPGPATWEMGSYPEGQGDHPVSGISWFEAAAFAEFAGKSLPTLHHWIISAGQGNAAATIPQSHFGGSGPAPAGRFEGLGPFGTRDMAGNVREWCWNASGDLRYHMGGAWSDPSYKFYQPTASSPFDRSAENGLRCVKYLSPKSLPDVTLKPMPMPFTRDFDKESPVSDETFAIYRRLYAYDKGDLNAVVENTDDASDHWTKEKITFDAAYGNERVIAYLFRPKSGAPPYQTIVFFPGDSAIAMASSAGLNTGQIDFLVKGGRAVLYPVYKSTFERQDGFRFESGRLTVNSWKDHVAMWFKDFGRSIDYLEDRPDVDTGRLAFMGYSTGAHLGVFLLGLETRIRAGILLVGGFVPFEGLKAVPEADHIHFAARIKVPILMLNGKHDFTFPLETAQKPLFRALGTPAGHKRHVTYETDHNLPRNEMIKETLDWLDKYLGPVKK